MSTNTIFDHVYKTSVVSFESCYIALKHKQHISTVCVLHFMLAKKLLHPHDHGLIFLLEEAIFTLCGNCIYNHCQLPLALVMQYLFEFTSTSLNKNCPFVLWFGLDRFRYKY